MDKTIKSTEPGAMQELDTLLGQFRHEAAHSTRPWTLKFEKGDGGSTLTIHLDPPKAE